MYEKARRGESIELSPRRISIFQFDIERSLDDRYPRFCLDVDKIWPMKPHYSWRCKIIHIFDGILYTWNLLPFFFSWTCWYVLCSWMTAVPNILYQSELCHVLCLMCTKFFLCEKSPRLKVHKLWLCHI